MISVRNIINHRMILFSGDIPFMMGKNTQLIVRENIFRKLSSYLLLKSKDKNYNNHMLYLQILKYIEHKITDFRM